MNSQFSFILSKADFDQFTSDGKCIKQWVSNGVIRKIETIFIEKDIKIIKSFDEKGYQHSYDDNYSYQKIVNGVTVKWKYFKHGKPHRKSGYAKYSISGNYITETSFIDGLEESINDFPSSIHYFPNGFIKHWKKCGVYFDRPNNKANLLCYYDGNNSIQIWKDIKNLPHNLNGPAIIVKINRSIQEYFFIHGIQVNEFHLPKVSDIKLDPDDSHDFDDLMREIDVVRNSLS